MKMLKHYYLFFIGLVLFACSKSKHTASSADLNIAGSDTELAVINDIADLFNTKHRDEYEVAVTGGGSSIGIQKLINGEVAIANSSRPMTRSEREKLEALNIEFYELVIAQDAISIIVDPGIGVQSLSTVDLSNIFTGRIKNWKELGGKNIPIKIMGRNENSGTRHYLENRFARYEGFGSNHIELPSNQSIVDKVKSTKGALGYVGIGYIMNSVGRPIQSVWTMQIYVEGGEAHSPYEMMAVSQGKYELSRPLYQYVVKNQPLAETFIKFERSEQSQATIRDHGFYLSNN